MELNDPPPHVIPAPRGLQQVSTLATCKTVITWMVQDASINGNPGLYVHSIRAFQKQEDCQCCEDHSLVGAPERILQRKRECKLDRSIFLQSESSWTTKTNAHEDCPWSRNKTFRMGDVALFSTP
jgi:hypothetical protein